MSNTAPNPSPEPTPEPQPKPAKKPKVKKPGRWRRRTIWTLSILIVLVLAIRALIPLALPMVLRKVAGRFGLNCTYDRLELNIISGDANIWGIKVLPKEGGPPVLETDYCHGNLSVLALLRGKLNVWRAEADGVDVNLDRNPDGHIPLLDRFVSSTATTATPPPAAPASSSAKPQPIDLSSPLRLDALRLTHIRVHIHDRAITPEVDTDLAMDLRLSDLGSPTSPAKFEMNLSADPILDSLKITGEGTSGGKNLNAKFNVICRGIHLKSAVGYLRPLGIVPIADNITLLASGSMHTAAAPHDADGFTGKLAFDHLSATVDGGEAMALDHLSLTADVVDAKSVHLGQLLIDGVRATAGRGSDGNLRVAGIEYNPAIAAVAKVPPAPAPSQGPPAILASLLAEPWSLGEAAVHHTTLTLHDSAVTPEVNLALIADELSAKNIDHDPSNLNTTVALSGLLHAPGVVRDIKLMGTVKPFAPTKTLHATLLATGIRPDAIRPYLDRIGVESHLKNSSFTASLDSSLSIASNGNLLANAQIGKIDFDDGPDLCSLNGIKIAGITLSPATSAIDVRSIEITGPDISAMRDKDGHFEAFGFCTKPRAAVVTAAAPAIANAPSAPAAKPSLPAPVVESNTIAALPRITIGSFIWKGIHLNLQEQSVQPPVALTLSDVGVEMKNLSTVLKADGKATPGHIHAWLGAADIARHLDFNGDLVLRKTGLDLDATVTGSGITLAGLKSYSRPLGLEPTLRDGSFTLHTKASVDQTADQGLSASLIADHMSYRDGATELTGFDEAAIKNVTFGKNELDVDSVKITRPRAIAGRDAAGSLEGFGVRLIKVRQSGAVPVRSDAVRPELTAGNATPSVAHSRAARPGSVAVVGEHAAPFVVVVKSLAIDNSSATWSDAAVRPTVHLTSGANLYLDNFVFGRTAAPATLTIIAHVDGALQNSTVTGTLRTAADAQSLRLHITGNGLRAGQLAAYFPPGVGCTLKDGRFRTTIDAGVSKNPAGGLAAHFDIGPSDFRDGPASPPLFKLDSARVDVPRIDLPDTALAIHEISATGVQTHAERAADGTLQMLGITIGAAHSDDKRDAGLRPVRPAPVMPNVAAKPEAPAASAPPAPAAASVADMVAAAHKALPLVTLDKLDLNLSKLTLTDLSRPESVPLVVSDLHLRNINRIEWLGKNAEGKPPTHLQLSCTINPLIKHLQIDTLIAPFAKQPTLQVDFAATGVRGDGLTALVPELKPKLDGSHLTDGSLTAHLEAEAKLDRQSPIDFDLSHGMDLSFDLTKFYYRAKPDGPVLAGVDEIRSDNIRIQPAQSIIHVKTLEIDKPIGLVSQDDAGIHVLGWVLKLPKLKADAATTQPAVAIAKEPATKPAIASAEKTPAAPAAKPKGEIRIDRLLISGLDAQFRDDAVTPPMMIPLNGLDVEVRNLSTLDRYEDRPIRFSAIVNSAKVNLKKRPDGGGGIAALVGGALVGTPDTKPPVMEQRDLFAQITANGEISLYPHLHGWAKTSVSGLDLAALEGIASQEGVTLTNGMYDSDVDVKFNPDGSIATNSRFIVTDLSLSEPPNGPISRSLNLPAPLDAAIGAVEGADGSIVFPLRIELKPNDISTSAIALAAANGIGQILINAIAASPVKAVGDVGALLGVPAGQKQAQTTTLSLPFAAGSVELDIASQNAMATLLQKMKEDPTLTATITHQLGGGDVSRSARRANPTKEECEALEQQLRARKVELLNLRSQTAGRAKARLLSLGVSGARSTLEQLSAIDRELAGIEDTLDQVCNLLRPGADSQAERRTRAAALRLAAVRLAEVKSALLAIGLPDIANRVKVIAPRFNPGDSSNGLVIITLVQKK